MTAKALTQLKCNACKKPFVVIASRFWKARVIAAGRGWTSRPTIGARGGQGVADFCPDCSALIYAESALHEPAPSE